MSEETPSRAAVEAVLRTVALADGRDLLAAGKVRSLVVEAGKVGFALAATDADRDIMEGIRAEVEAKLKALPGTTRVLGALVDDGGAPPPTAEPPQRKRGGGLMGRMRRLAGGGAEQAGAVDEAGAGRSGKAGGRPAPAPSAGAGTPQPRGPAPGRPGGPQGQGGRPGGPQGQGGRPGGPHSQDGRPGGPQGQGGPPAGPRGQGGQGGASRSGPLPGVARIVAVGAGKGGVGKSTVSFNLAVALAALGWRVGLLDADIYGPSVPTLVGADNHRPAAPGGGFMPFNAHGISAMSIGFLVAPEKAMIWRGPMVTGALNQLLRDTVWGELDCLIIDMPPGTGDIALSLAQQTPLAGAVVVTTPQDLALIDVRKAAGMFRAVNVPLLGMVENMSGFVCPRCGEVTDIFGAGGGEREAEASGIPFLGKIGLSMGVREASDAGLPVALSEGAVGDAYRQIAAALMDALVSADDQPFPAIVFE
ncbi:MAG: Mrp/NBP35 family ATP-binding protein [Pseudomonadota bacterium]